MKTKAHVFDFDTNTPKGAAGYAALKAQLANHPRKMRSLTGPGESYLQTGKRIEGLELELETNFLFENQWNTAPIEGISDKGLRVFDWAEDAIFDNHGGEKKNLRRGYYLEQTEEMQEARRNNNKCGYCGHMERAERGLIFCDRCRDSEYLKSSELHLTRMRPIDTLFNENRAPLTEAEQAHLLPLYREAQIHGSTERGKKRIAARMASITKERENAINKANTEYHGLLWLMNNGINTDNVIFYKHTGRFGFGWRSPVDAELLSTLLDVISEFRWPYDIKCADGRTLSGN